MPDFAARHAEAYTGKGVRDLCAALHDFYRRHEASRVQGELFQVVHLPEQVMSPA
ncbi:hypothetical protein [Acidocella sp.]|uniref:Orn/Lys/Arg family decarboxylase n=1 Tax=Acidocella sp. TaxID=50710 RepID=UPI0026113CC3|nr:hypothetical protein [Acidocella sp.]